MGKVKFGISNVYYSVITETNNGITYATPVRLPGAVSFSADPEGESTPFYADNIVYYQSVSNQGYSGASFVPRCIVPGYCLHSRGCREGCREGFVDWCQHCGL